jgi:hypothetical protein
MPVSVKVEDKTIPPPKTTVKVPDKSVKDQRQENFEGIGQLASFGCIVTGNFADAGAISMHWPNVSKEAAELAESNEYVARAADFLGQVGPFSAILAAALPLAFQILANHKVIPAAKMGGAGVVDPQTLESQVKTQMALQALEALKAQHAMEEELQRAQAEYAEFTNGESAKQSA